MFNYAKAIGANTDVVTAQAFVFPRVENPDELLVLLIAGIGEDGFAIIRKAGLDTEELFFAQDNVSQSFEKTTAFIKSELSLLEQFSAIIGFFEKETLYVETINQFSCLLLRQNHTIELTRGLENEKLISGLLQEEDRVLFLSPPLTETENSDIQKSLETNLLRCGLENLEFELESFLQQLPKPDPVAVVLVENIAEQQQQQQPNSPSSFQSEDPEVEKREPVNPISLDGARTKTPFLVLIFLSLLQKISWGSISKKKLLLFITIIGLVLFMGINLLISNLKKDADFKTKISQAQQKYEQALQAKDSDSAKSKTLLAESKASLKEAELTKPGDGKIKDLDQKINEGSFLILKQFEQKDFPLFLDLNLIKDNFSASRLSMSLGKMAVLDKTSKSLIVIDIGKKQPQILAGSLQLGDVQLISLNGDYVYVFSKDKGILKVDAGNGKTTQEVKPDSEWQRIVDIFGFANNVYLLDEFKNRIWKYIATEKGFSDRNQYLREGESTDFAAARNLQIDGAVWVLKSDNTILKFIQGGKDFFQLGQIDPSLDKIKNFFISDETDKMYFLDNENSRVVMTDKKGQYLSQYTGDKFKTANDLVVDEKGKKLYLLEGGKIYQVDLK